MTQLDSFLQYLEERIRESKRGYRTVEDEAKQRIEEYENTLKSKKASKEFKAVASLSIVTEYSDLARMAGEISLLHGFQILALNAKILENSINDLSKQLEQSGILEKARDIDDIKKLKKLLESQYEKRGKMMKQMEEAYKKMEESRKKAPSYID